MARVAIGGAILSPPRRSSKRRRCDGHMAEKHYIEKGEVTYRLSLPPGGELGYHNWQNAILCADCAPEPTKQSEKP